MSSAIIPDGPAARAATMTAARRLLNDSLDEVARLGMSPRQRELNRRWAHYTTMQYGACAIDWEGDAVAEDLDAEQIVQEGQLPPGFVEAGAALPLKFRRPLAPYHIVRLVVRRFTGLLFSERRHPRITCAGDPDTEALANALCDEARLWQTMNRARNYGGAQGSVAVGFYFVDGRPVVEVWDARWCFPTFVDRRRLVLESIEERYWFTIERQDPETRGWVTEMYWYRRVVDAEREVVWPAVPVGKGEEPPWDAIEHEELVHGLGFCPVYWVQNTEDPSEVDGEPDAIGIYDTAHQIDMLVSQAVRGTIANADPTLVLENIGDDAKVSDLRKGSDNALTLTKGSAKYLELAGAGAKAALETADNLRARALEQVQCVLDDPDPQAARTATEVLRRHAAMLEAADVLREQYGQRGVLLLVEGMLAAVRQRAGRVKLGEGGALTTEVVRIPPRVLTDPATKKPIGTEPHRFGAGGKLSLVWPRYFDPSLDDIAKAVDVVAKGLAAGVMTIKMAVTFLADYLPIDDVHALIEELQAQAAARKTDMQASLMGAMGGYSGGAL